MRLRPYQPGEETQLWELAQGVGLQGQPPAGKTGPAQWAEQLRSQLPFVVEYDNQVIGTVSLERAGEIGHFYVRQNWQGRGVGTLLMHKVHQQAEEQGVTELTAFVCQAAVAFFERWGFVAMPQRQHAAAQGHVSSGIWMSKNLIR